MRCSCKNSSRDKGFGSASNGGMSSIAMGTAPPAPAVDSLWAPAAAVLLALIPCAGTGVIAALALPKPPAAPVPAPDPAVAGGAPLSALTAATAAGMVVVVVAVVGIEGGGIVG